MTDKDVLPKNELSKKAAVIKRFKYIPLVSEFKKQTGIAKEHYQRLGKICGFSKTVVSKKHEN